MFYSKKFVKILFLTAIITSLSFLFSSKAEADVCDNYCAYYACDPGTMDFYDLASGQLVCTRNCAWAAGGCCCRIIRCDCDPGPGTCYVGSAWYGSCTSLCSALGGSCPDTSTPSCTASCGDCSSGTYYSSPPDNYYASGSRTCKRTDCSTYTQTCYSACPTVSSCSSQGYVDSCPAGATCIPKTITESVPSGCDGTRDCFLTCPEASCDTYEDGSGIDWTDTISDRGMELTIPIDAPAGCPTEDTKMCYTANTRPVLENVEILTDQQSAMNPVNTPLLDRLVSRVNAQVDNSVLGYTNNTHTGTQLNNPLTVRAQFSDADGLDDIQALSIWWSTSSTKNFVTPTSISDPVVSGQTANNANYGFMIAKNTEGNWQNLYRPHIDGETKVWVQDVSPSTDSITINGPTGKSMVNISSVVITEDENTGILTLEFNMEFYLQDAEKEEVLSSNNYNIWGIGNDTVGYLPFGGTDIEDVEDEYWTNSNTIWPIDLKDPIISGELAITHLTDENLAVRFDIQDNETELDRVRLEACRTTVGDNTEAIYIDGNQLENCSSVNWGSLDPTDIDMEEGNDLLGTDPTDPNSSTYSFDSTPLELTLTGNLTGSVTFYLTFMDQGGNWNQDVEILRLGEWAIVKGGFVFGKLGVSSSTRIFEDDNVWDPDIVLKSRYNFQETKVDITDQALLGSTAYTALGFLERIAENNSFKAGVFPGLYDASPYAQIVDAYEGKVLEASISDYQEYTVAETTISNDILSLCDENPTLCVLRKDGNLNISSSSECNGKGLLIVNGDLTINPDFTNTDDTSACIFLVSGDISIENGENKDNTLVGVDYDIVEAFMISGSNINIPSDSAQNGLAIEGGLVSFGDIDNLRQIALNVRNHPVLAVTGSPKYGLLSKILFGSQVDMFRVDIGFKPY